MEAEQQPFTQAWRDVEASWDEEAAHRRFIALCDSLGQLGEAGRRYRRVADDDPERREVAQRWIDEVLTAALKNMATTRTPTEERKGRARLLALAFGAVLLTLSCWALLRAVSR